MPITRTIAAVASAAALAVTGLLAVAPMASGAVPASSLLYTKCRIHHSANYPPGKCYLRFNKASYHRHMNAKFVSGKDFKPGEPLKLVLRCKSGYHRHRNLVHGFSYHHVGPKGRVHGHIHLTHITPYGTCTLTVRGLSSNSKVRGSFKVHKVHKKHHHHHKKK
ncbi:MAG TPA: hypothetical protein VMH41_09450 [Mycobacteriales bacterium]|nr:hypothetical protein [Mycobacteriales bacterium]